MRLHWFLLRVPILSLLIFLPLLESLPIVRAFLRNEPKLKSAAARTEKDYLFDRSICIRRAMLVGE
jgi:hypothetical protein